MSSPALDIQGSFSVFGGFTTFYPGESLTFTFENGTELGPVPWLALYNSPGDTGPLATGGDFYNFFVLGFYPASYNPDPAATGTGSTPPTTATSSDSSAATSTNVAPTPTPTAWNNTAYPQNPDVVQPDLRTNGGGFLTGYFMNDSSTAVLSIPSFDAYGDAIGTFSATIGEFLQRSKEAGLKKVVIDVQQNGGGDTLLAIDAFKQVEPPYIPFAHPELIILPVLSVN